MSFSFVPSFFGVWFVCYLLEITQKFKTQKVAFFEKTLLFQGINKQNFLNFRKQTLDNNSKTKTRTIIFRFNYWKYERTFKNTTNIKTWFHEKSIFTSKASHFALMVYCFLFWLLQKQKLKVETKQTKNIKTQHCKNILKKFGVRNFWRKAKTHTTIQ